MEAAARELGLPPRCLRTGPGAGACSAVVHVAWLQQVVREARVAAHPAHPPRPATHPGEPLPWPWRRIYIRALPKKTGKVLPLPRSKVTSGRADTPYTLSQLLKYVSETNHRNLWKEAYKKYSHNNDSKKESSLVNLMDHDQLLSEVILRLYGCNIIKIKSDSAGIYKEYTEIPNKYVSKSYEAHSNILPAICALETENNFFLIYNTHFEYNLIDSLTFSPALLDSNYSRPMFLIYQLLQMAKAMGDRGLSFGNLLLQDIFLTENLWLQVMPEITNNIHLVDTSLISEQKSKASTSGGNFSPSHKKNTINTKEDPVWRSSMVQLEQMCNLWIRGSITNLAYLLYLNELAGRRLGDPQAHYVVPWVTDFASRGGRNWRDFTKSKYRLTKGDRQLDMTYDTFVRENNITPSSPTQTPHHVSDVLSDITYYVYTARRTPKEILCKHVRNNWVPAEYPASIQRMQEWTPDECIPEFYTDPTVFKSLHEDLPDLGVPSWASCVEDFVMKHREALESTHVSENLHHWIDLTFGYKLSGVPSVKAKNVCLSLVDGHTRVRRGGAVQLLVHAHPPRPSQAQLPAPPTIHWTREKRKQINDSSDEISEEEEESSSYPQHISRLSVPTNRVRSRNRSATRTRSTSKDQEAATTHTIEPRASSTARHYRVQKSELGKGVIYLPKEYNPAGMLVALEQLDHFKTKCFYSKFDDKNKTEDVSLVNLYPMPKEDRKYSTSSGYNVELTSDKNSFTNHMFLASYDQNYIKKFNQDVNIESMLKERKNRTFNNRYTTDGSVYKQFITESRRQDMLVIGCLLVEIFLHSQVRPLKSNTNNFLDRYNCCRTVLKHNYHLMPKCVIYVAGLLLNVDHPGQLDLMEEVTLSADKVTSIRKIVITDKGLPSPTPSQLLQPLLANHLIPFPPTFIILYHLLVTLHEFELTSKELSMLYTYECDGIQCEIYQHIDKTKLYFNKRIAEGKIQACASHLELFINKLPCYNQFDVIDLFLPHYIELLENKETSILAAWYLFDTVSRSLGPVETRRKLLKHILNLYEDDDIVSEKLEKDADTGKNNDKRKSVKLYHNIFLLQLIVRLGQQCFLEHFTQHLVEAVGGYKDTCIDIGSPGHMCLNKSIISKKPRYSDETVKSALSATSEILSPDTSFSSENIMTPNVDKSATNIDRNKENVTRSDPEVFHFETDNIEKQRISRSKSPADSIDSFSSSNTGTQELINEIPPSPTIDMCMPQSNIQPIEKITTPTKVGFAPDVKLNFDRYNHQGILDSCPGKPMSPTIPIPSSLNASHHHFGDENSFCDDVELRDKVHETARPSKSLDLGRQLLSPPHISGSRNFNNEFDSDDKNDQAKSCKISDMSAESLIWLAHRLGPVLTCRYITRNLLKMLTLCYIGKENLTPNGDANDQDDIESTSIAGGAIIGDMNAKKVISCLTSIVALYGEQLILFQYLPHMGELIASCRRRLSAPLEGGVIACLQLLKYLVPLITDVKLMEQLPDVLLKSILHPTVRLLSTTRSSFPSGVVARKALATKFLDALYVVAVRIGPEMTRKHLCVPALQRFFLAFDKATGKTENWPKPEVGVTEEVTKESCLLGVADFYIKELDLSHASQSIGKEAAEAGEAGEGEAGRDGSGGSLFVEICRDGTTAEWCVREGCVVRGDSCKELSCSPPDSVSRPDGHTTAQEELLMVFNSELAHKAFVPFYKFVGAESMERSLKNSETVHDLCQNYDHLHRDSQSCDIRHPNFERRLKSLSDDGISRRSLDRDTKPVRIGMEVHLGRSNEVINDNISSSNSFGSNVALVGNRIDVASDFSEYGNTAHNVLDVVSCKMDNGVKSNRHLRGDWLIYWEHEIGRPDKENRFNLKQIKLQSFSGHTHTVKCIHCMDNENSFMSGSKDKTVRLWSLRNQGDGSAVSQCHFTYSGHRKGILSLTFLESLRMTVSTDSVVHIWDPFMESVVSQLDSMKAPVSIVKTMPAPSPVVIAATTDSALKMIDARCCTFTHDLKVTLSSNTFIRCVCVSPSGRWVAVGLATGHLAIVDPRTGLLVAHWKAHDGEILQLVTVNESNIVSSSLDQTMMVWSTVDGKLKFHLKGSTEPVHCLSVYHSELISGTTNNRIGVHTGVEQDASFSSTKLRSDTFKGVLTSMAVLPLNRLLLLGSDSGNISLLC